jgi:SpoVK/Ycf46/Vps4 family AAA+-type ATPase
MRELALVTGVDPEWAGRELCARSADVARRVAAVVEESCRPESGAEEAVAFIKRWADSAVAPGEDENPSLLVDHPLDLLGARYGLTTRESELLLLAGLPEQHEGLAATFRTFHPQGEPRPTVGLAALVFGDGTDARPMMRRLLAEGAAARGRLINTVGNCTLFEQSVVLAEKLWDALHGYDAWPSTLNRMVVDGTLVGLEQWLDGLDQQRAARALEEHEAVTVLVNSPDERVALGRCAALAARAGAELVAARCSPDEPDAIGQLVAIAAARGAIPVIVVTRPSEPAGVAQLALEAMPAPIMVCAPPGGVRIGAQRAVLTVPTGPVGMSDHCNAWRATLPHLAGKAATLAARHPIDPAIYPEVATDAQLYERLGPKRVGLAEVSTMIRTRASVALPAGVTMTTPNVPWQRLVLPQDSAAQLTDAVSRLELEPLVLDEWGLRDRARASRGVRLLFCGPPGTGKSLAAEVIATAASTDLLIVDVSQIVSKWLGETEKNVSAVIDAAERIQAVLFFDEADALFAKRTEISDAHDRYANLETSYLLQRIDHFQGLVVLATNLRHNIDAAFLRRMDFVVDFALPDLDCRRELWTLHLPTEVLANDVDVDILARMYPVPGGWIRNTAIAAAFLAADSGRQLSQQHLLSAMRREYLKAALPFPGEPPRRRDDQML